MIVAHNLGCFFFMIPQLVRDCVAAEYTQLADDGSKDFLAAGGAATGIYYG